MSAGMLEREPLLRFFDADDPVPALRHIAHAAIAVARELEPSAERTIALRKLLEAEDAVRRATQDAFGVYGATVRR